MADPAPSRVRWGILALLFAISVVTYIDRVNISVTARQMAPALGLTDVQMGQVFSAFVLGYALFQIPGGWLGDRWGARWVLTMAVLWWSVFTALTAVAATLPLAAALGVLGALVSVRFLIGVGEAAALPNFNRAVANWLPSTERGLGIGVAIGGIGVGSAITPPITAWIMVNYGWQAAFYVCALLGLVVAGAWFLYATDRPEDHPRVNAAEAALIAGGRATDATPLAPTPWKAVARTPTVWGLVASYTCLGYVAYVYMSWFYLYLVNVRGFGELRGAVFAAAPFVAMMVFCPLGGWVTDRLAARLGTNPGRAVVGAAGMVLSSVSILIGGAVESHVAAIGLLSLGAGWLYFTVGAFWASTVDLSKTHAGTLSGLMNTGANLGGTVSPTLTPWIAEQFGWSASLATAALIACCGGILWLWIRPGDGLREVSCEIPTALVESRPMPLKFEKKNPRATILTKFGEIVVRFYPDDAPRHVENFINLAKMGFYDGTTFHRVVPKTLIQGGDPLSRERDRNLHGTGGPGYFIEPEPSDRPHRRGTVSTAKLPRQAETTRDFNDNGSQFFICLADNSGLDRRYTVFGQVIRGMEVVDKIASMPRDERDNPLEPIVMQITAKE